MQLSCMVNRMMDKVFAFDNIILEHETGMIILTNLLLLLSA